VENREPFEQTVLLAGFPGVSLKDPRSDALALLQTAMSGLSSDLAVSVRDKRGLGVLCRGQPDDWSLSPAHL